MRGAVIWDIGALTDPEKKIPNGPAFIGDESLGYISVALNSSKRLGLDLGMVASSRWNTGGPLIDPSDASMQLLSTSRIVEGPSSKSITIKKPENECDKMNRHTLITSIAILYSASKAIDRAD